MDWAQIFERLTADQDDALAWVALELRIKAWARAEFWANGHHLIDDAVVDTCAAIALGLPAARGPETFSGFAYGHFLNARRRLLRTLQPGSVSIHGIDIVSPDQDDDELDAEARARLWRALAALPARERKVVMLRYFEELPSTRIAAEVGVTSVNARRILFNGLRRMRSLLRDPQWVREATAQPAHARLALDDTFSKACFVEHRHTPLLPADEPVILVDAEPLVECLARRTD